MFFGLPVLPLLNLKKVLPLLPVLLWPPFLNKMALLLATLHWPREKAVANVGHHGATIGH